MSRNCDFSVHFNLEPVCGMAEISFIERKPEPLGTKFKYILYYKKGDIICLETQRGKYNDLSLSYGNSNSTNA